MTNGTTPRRRRDATWLVALGAALWGSDALLRLPLVDRSYPASTIVFLEHVVIVLVTLPWVLPALRAFSGSSARTKAAVLVIGAGASALATVLFTQAFVYAPQDSAAITPVVLQKLQPVIAVMVAWWLLKERITLRYPLFLVPALAGAWLLAFPNPLEVSVAAGLAAGLAVGAAALWATGTVLGRMVGAEIGLRDLTVLRFLFGLPASLVLVLALGDPLTVELQDTPVVVALGLIPGLLAIALYYRGLRSTPASRATLAELAFPLTAAVVGVAFLGSTLTGTQWIGGVVVAAAVTALALHERFSRHKAVATPVAGRGGRARPRRGAVTAPDASRGVLVTGASRGIGAAVAQAFAERGDRVAVHYRGARDRAEQVLDRLPGEGHLLVQGDLADPAAVQDFVQAAARGLGRVDVLVNNAALFTDDPGHLADGGSRRVDHRVHEVGYDDWVAAWRRTVEVNLLGTANVTWCVVRQMLDVPAAPGVPTGRVVNVGSRGAYRGEPDVPAYGASKAAVHAFGQSMALALGEHGIAVATVAPGFVATDMAGSVLDGPGGDAVLAQSPFGRVAEPEEVAAAVVFLADPLSQWASGAVLDLNGASYLR